MIDYTLLTVISIVALMLVLIMLGMVISLSTRVDELHVCLMEINDYTDKLSHKIANQRADFNRSLLTSERKEHELDERMSLLQQRLNVDRMQNIIDGKIAD